jgi:hypothetical protein
VTQGVCVVCFACLGTVAKVWRDVFMPWIQKSQSQAVFPSFPSVARPPSAHRIRHEHPPCARNKAKSEPLRPAGNPANKKESTCVEDTRAPGSLQPGLRHQNAHKFDQYNQCSRLKKNSVNRCVTIRSEDREIIASSTRSNERRQAPGPSVNFKEETYTNGDLRNEGQKTQAERLKLQTEN